MLVFWGAELWYYLLSFLSESCLTFENNLASIYNMYRHKKIDSTLLEFNYCKMFSACFYITLHFIRWKALNFMDWSFSVVAAKNYSDWHCSMFPRNKVSEVPTVRFPFRNIVCAEYSLIFSQQGPNIVILRNKKFMSSKVNGGLEKTGWTLWKLGEKFSSETVNI